MILVDSSVWVRHFREGLPRLTALLDERQVLGHRLVRGELAMGNLASRALTLRHLGNLPQAAMATDDEVLLFVESERLYGLGVGYVDAHLLAAARLSESRLWTLDRRAQDVASRLGLAQD